jgi:hypothetical protein
MNAVRADLMDAPCVVCADTGKWSGSPEPCPECGAFAPLRKQAKREKWRPQDNYLELETHYGPNRKERRRQKSRRYNKQ